MNLALRPYTDKALLNHQILTSLDLVIKWKTKGLTCPESPSRPLVIYKRFPFWMLQTYCLYLFSLKTWLYLFISCWKVLSLSLSAKVSSVPFQTLRTLVCLWEALSSATACLCDSCCALLPVVTEMISAPVLCWKILGRGNGLSMLQNIDLFPILSVASESHGAGVRDKQANLLRALAASLMYVLFI